MFDAGLETMGEQFGNEFANNPQVTEWLKPFPRPHRDALLRKVFQQLKELGLPFTDLQRCVCQLTQNTTVSIRKLDISRAQETAFIPRKKRRRRVIISDSESDDNSVLEVNGTITENQHKLEEPSISVIDQSVVKDVDVIDLVDSDDEIEQSPMKRRRIRRKRRFTELFGSDSEDETNTLKLSEKSLHPALVKKYDSDFSDDFSAHKNPVDADAKFVSRVKIEERLLEKTRTTGRPNSVDDEIKDHVCSDIQERSSEVSLERIQDDHHRSSVVDEHVHKIVETSHQSASELLKNVIIILDSPEDEPGIVDERKDISNVSLDKNEGTTDIVESCNLVSSKDQMHVVESDVLSNFQTPSHENPCSLVVNTSSLPNAAAEQVSTSEVISSPTFDKSNITKNNQITADKQLVIGIENQQEATVSSSGLPASPQETSVGVSRPGYIWVKDKRSLGIADNWGGPSENPTNITGDSAALQNTENECDQFDKDEELLNNANKVVKFAFAYLNEISKNPTLTNNMQTDHYKKLLISFIIHIRGNLAALKKRIIDDKKVSALLVHRVMKEDPSKVQEFRTFMSDIYKLTKSAAKTCQPCETGSSVSQEQNYSPSISVVAPVPVTCTNERSAEPVRSAYAGQWHQVAEQSTPVTNLTQSSSSSTENIQSPLASTPVVPSQLPIIEPTLQRNLEPNPQNFLQQHNPSPMLHRIELQKQPQPQDKTGGTLSTTVQSPLYQQAPPSQQLLLVCSQQEVQIVQQQSPQIYLWNEQQQSLQPQQLQQQPQARQHLQQLVQMNLQSQIPFQTQVAQQQLQQQYYHPSQLTPVQQTNEPTQQWVHQISRAESELQLKAQQQKTVVPINRLHDYVTQGQHIQQHPLIPETQTPLQKQQLQQSQQQQQRHLLPRQFLPQLPQQHLQQSLPQPPQQQPPQQQPPPQLQQPPQQQPPTLQQQFLRQRELIRKLERQQLLRQKHSQLQPPRQHSQPQPQQQRQPSQPQPQQQRHPSQLQPQQQHSQPQPQQQRHPSQLQPQQQHSQLQQQRQPSQLQQQRQPSQLQRQPSQLQPQQQQHTQLQPQQQQCTQLQPQQQQHSQLQLQQQHTQLQPQQQHTQLQPQQQHSQLQPQQQHSQMEHPQRQQHHSQLQQYLQQQQQQQLQHPQLQQQNPQLQHPQKQQQRPQPQQQRPQPQQQRPQPQQQHPQTPQQRPQPQQQHQNTQPQQQHQNTFLLVPSTPVPALLPYSSTVVARNSVICSAGRTVSSEITLKDLLQSSSDPLSTTHSKESGQQFHLQELHSLTTPHNKSPSGTVNEFSCSVTWQSPSGSPRSISLPITTKPPPPYPSQIPHSEQTQVPLELSTLPSGPPSNAGSEVPCIVRSLQSHSGTFKSSVLMSDQSLPPYPLSPSNKETSAAHPCTAGVHSSEQNSTAQVKKSLPELTEVFPSMPTLSLDMSHSAFKEVPNKMDENDQKEMREVIRVKEANKQLLQECTNVRKVMEDSDTNMENTNLRPSVLRKPETQRCAMKNVCEATEQQRADEVEVDSELLWEMEESEKLEVEQRFEQEKEQQMRDTEEQNYLDELEGTVLDELVRTADDSVVLSVKKELGEYDDDVICIKEKLNVCSVLRDQGKLENAVVNKTSVAIKKEENEGKLVCQVVSEKTGAGVVGKTKDSEEQSYQNDGKLDDASAHSSSHQRGTAGQSAVAEIRAGVRTRSVSLDSGYKTPSPFQQDSAQQNKKSSETRPLTPVICDREREVICAVCQEEAQVVCSQCKATCYCNVKCQTEHWYKGHSQECMSVMETVADSDKCNG